MCEVKNCHGVDAAHSSPMNSIGVNGPVSTSTAAIARSSADSRAVSRSPAARLPIWSWFCEYPMNRQAGVISVSTGRP